MDMVIKRNIFSIIGTDVRRCLYCGGVLSFRDNNSFFVESVKKGYIKLLWG